MLTVKDHKTRDVPVQRRGYAQAKSIPQLLCSRRQSADAIGCSVSSVIRLEKDGMLTPVRLSRKPTGAVYYAYEELVALTQRTP